MMISKLFIALLVAGSVVGGSLLTVAVTNTVAIECTAKEDSGPAWVNPTAGPSKGIGF
jgi:hypothetical protein